MLATLVEEAFDDPQWLFEVKWDGYRALAIIENGQAKFFSRNQNEMTGDFPELRELPSQLQASTAVLDGEICALDDQGRSSFSLMQQRTGFEPSKLRRRKRGEVDIVYYVFDLLYLDGYSLFHVALETRKRLLASRLQTGHLIRYSDHIEEKGVPLFKVASDKGLEGIVAKRRDSFYSTKRTRDWLKVKIRHTQECVIGGYTDPRGSREHFGSIVLGLYDERGRLLPVGQAGSGFTHKTHEAMWKKLKELETDNSPFAEKPGSSRGLHFVKPQLVAEIKFSEWTHPGAAGGPKMRAPVFTGIRFDKKPPECVFEIPKKAAPHS